MHKLLVLTILTLLFSVGPSTESRACNECEYKDDTLGICLRKSGCILSDAGRAAQRTINLAGALVSGDRKRIQEAIGEVFLNSPGCLGCAYAARTILPDLTPEQINRIAGRGVLVFYSTLSPVLVVIDVAANVATEHAINASATRVPTPPPANRGHLEYSGKSLCMVKRNNEIFAGWITNPVFTPAPTGASFTFPEIDLRADDVLDLTADDCPELTDPNSGAVSVTRARLKFVTSDVLPGGPKTMKYWIIGKVE